MTELLHRRTFPPETLIFREGEAGDCAFVIEEGQVEISALHGGKEVVLARLGEGELFGEMALLDGQVRSATARTTAHSELVVIRRDQVQRKINSADPVIKLFVKVILRRLRTTNELVEPVRKDEPSRPELGPDDSLLQVRDRAMTLLQLEHDLERGLERGEYRLRYQPIIELVTGQVAGFEALLRWHHPERGTVPPDQFIGMAERTGLIVPIGRWVLEEACTYLRRLQRHAPHRHLFMGVNLSPRQVASEGVVETIRQITEEAGVAPPSIKLEVTESVLLEDPAAAVSVLNRLKALGFEIAIDDFGTGYSSLSYLHRFPIDVLKVDRSFVSSLLSDPASRKIVCSIVTLAKELELRVVAEGVERPQEAELLRELGSDYGQGYLFSRPLPADEAEQTVGQTLLEPSATGAHQELPQS